MAAIRALGIVIVLIAFFLIGTPLQWLLSRYAPTAAHCIPIFFCRSLLWLLRVDVSIAGVRTSGRPVMTVANHVSWIDILALGGVEPFCFLAKSEVSGWPILSAFAEVQGTVFINRRRSRTIPTANRMMATRMRQGRPVLLFPEGTTTAAAEPGAFRTSHFAAARDLLRADTTQSAVDVQPVAIAYSAPHAAWVGDDDLVGHLWRTLRAAPLRCIVSFGAPIPFVAESDRKVVAKAARASIVDMLAHVFAERHDVKPALELAQAAAPSA